MIAGIKKFFKQHNIELYGAVEFNECSIINSRKQKEIEFINPKSVLVISVPYYTGEYEGRNISRYAVSRDYHIYFKHLFSELSKLFAELFPENNFMYYADNSPIDEREAAYKAGLGKKGKNNLLVTEEYGSYVFLGEVISDLDISEYYEKEEIIPEYRLKECQNCGACISSCPFNFNGCLSAITQKRGTPNRIESEAMVKYNTVWGCDICQEVCPENADIKKTPIGFFYENPIFRLERNILENMSDEEFSKRAWSWRGRGILLRNIEIMEACGEGRNKYDKQ